MAAKKSVTKKKAKKEVAKKAKPKKSVKKAKLPTQKRITKKSPKTRQPFAKQTGRDDKGHFIKGNKTGNRFESGASGNPAGPPKSKVQLWRYFCNFMEMTDIQLKRVVKKKLTQAQKTALKLVTDMVSGQYSGSQHLARHVFDRDEGRPVEHVVIEPGDVLTDEECEEIREQLLRNHANSN